MLSEDEDSVDADFYTTLQENALLPNVFKQHGSPRSFVTRSERIFVRSLVLDSSAADVFLDYQTDIDGCVIELNDITGVSMSVRHLTLCPSGVFNVKEVKPMLKKHVQISQYSTDALCNFNNSFGIQLFYEHGWECWLALIPEFSRSVHRLVRDVIRNDTFAVIQQVKCDFRSKLAELAKTGLCYRTLAKNDLSDIGKVFVMPDDCSQVLLALQEAIQKIKMRHFQPIVFCFRFGEKMKNGLSLCHFRTDAIKKVTVHAAVDISCHVDGVELLWSSYGVQQLVGNRGTLSTCLSLFDCVNYQSNLDGKIMDIKPELRRVFCHPEKVNFVQLYADLPHVRPKTRLHPVSGIIAGGLCFPANTANAYRRDARKYLSTMVHNFSMLRHSTCRLEGVCELTEISDVIQGNNCIDVGRLDSLLQDKALLSPVPSETMNCIKAVGLWLCEELSEMLHHESTGNVYATWRAFQCELACEKLLWGRPLGIHSSVYSINLGPGVLGASRSLTDTLGFLALEHPTTCMVTEDSIPPTAIWTCSIKLGDSIRRAAGLHDHLDASFPVIGRLLVVALLKDLHATGKMEFIRFEQFLALLKTDPPTLPVVGASTFEDISRMLAMKRRHSVFAVFGRLCGLIEKDHLPLIEVIDAGLNEIDLKLFPAVETLDTHDNAVLKWDRRMKYWKVFKSSECSAAGTLSPELYCQLCKAVLETRGLIFPSRLKMLPANDWPWVEPCLKRLERENLCTEKKVTILAFVSAIALLMQGWYVDFDKFARLVDDLPIPQFRLKNLEILSKLQLAKFNHQKLRVFRLHESIPHQIKRVEKSKTESVRDESPPEQMPDEVKISANRIPEDEDFALSAQEIQPRASICQPAGLDFKVKWSTAELEILDAIMSQTGSKSMSEMYGEYLEMTKKKHITFRTLEAFKRKIQRLKCKVH